MLFAALRDMQWRMRRLVIAVVSAGLVFAMTLVLTGLANGFQVEAQRTVDSMGVDAFVVKAGAAGPFLGATPFAQAVLTRVADAPGVVAAAPLAIAASTIGEGTATHNVTAFGAPEHGPGMPRVSQGRPPSTPDEVAVSSTLGRGIGDDLQVGSRTLRIVGIVPNSTTQAKRPNIFLTTEGLQQLAYNGQPLITSIGIVGTPRQLPNGYQAVDRPAGVSDLLRPVKDPAGAITIVAFLLWIVAVLIIGSLVYLSTLERLRDFAVFKAIGVPTRSILAGLALQAVVVALLAAVLGVILAQGAGTAVPDECRNAYACLRGATGDRDCGRSAGQRRWTKTCGGGRSGACVRRSLTSAHRPSPSMRATTLRATSGLDSSPNPSPTACI
jgi:putative ABC transport system permease protein